METNYKRTVAGSIGAGMGAFFNATGRTYYILEHKTSSKYHQAGESQKIIVDQIELGRDSSCQVRFDESFETVSRRHAAIVRDGADWKLIPLSTTNATIVNGQIISGEWHLTSGDEIRLSSRGPVIGFILPQGERSLVKSIGLTERMNLFRQQALRPYKTALWILAVVLLLAVTGLVTWNVLQGKKFERELNEKQEQIVGIGEKLDESNMVIDALNEELVNAQEESKAERARTQRKLNQAKAEREALLQEAEDLRNATLSAMDAAARAGQEVRDAKNQIEQLEEKMKESDSRIHNEPEVKSDSKPSVQEIIKRQSQSPNFRKSETTTNQGGEKKLKKF